MPIEIEMRAERRPGGDPQIAQSKFWVWVDEVEVVMQTFRLYGLGGDLSSGLVVMCRELGKIN